MEENISLTTGGSVRNNELMDFYATAMSNIMYGIGDGINKFYFPLLIPIGVTGNILSFLVMIQQHNRHMSMSLYIAVLAVSDTIALVLALISYLNTVHDVEFPPNQLWLCRIATTVLWSSTMCSTLFIINMTFDRFYSIIRPHKAASFNTVKRAKITIVCVVIFSTCINIPYLFIMTHEGRECFPDLSTDGKAFYQWFSYVIQFIIPFVSLLTMNSVIIHTLRTRTVRTGSQGSSAVQGQGQNRLKSSEKQIFAILLLVAFSFFILVTPLYAFNIYNMVFDYTKSPKAFAGFFLFYHVMHKLYFTNNAINFFLYVISGNKFRTDLMNLFKRCRKDDGSLKNIPEPKTKISTIESEM